MADYTMSTSCDSVLAGKKIWITGHRGMLGSAMVRRFANSKAKLLLTSHSELDLINQSDVLNWMKTNKPDMVFHIGAKVGGVHANSIMPADFLYNNIMIQTNVIYGAYLVGCEKLLFVATNCCYPSRAMQPINEDSLFAGKLDETIRYYAIGKISGIEMCRAINKQHGTKFVSVIPPNLYGPGDNYHPLHSHIVAGILRRVHEAKVNRNSNFVVWGDGTPRRELLHIDDAAEAMKVIMCENTHHDLYNIGVGYDLSVAEIATIIRDVVGYKGEIVYDLSKPNGTMSKLLDSTRINSLGWRAHVGEHEGITSAYKDYLSRFGA